MRDRTASCYSLPRLAIAKGFHMRSLHSRPVCRAHNTFSPSVALWQHFIIPNQHLLQRRFLSSSTTKRSSIDGSLEPTETRGTNGSDLASPVETPPKVRLIRTGVGKFLVNHSLFSKYRKNPKRKQTELPEARQPPGARQPETPPEAEKLWALVRQAYNSAEDYKGVSVQPMRTHVQVSESKLPWTVKNQKSLSGEDRLALEIQAFHKYVQPNRAERFARKHTIEEVRKHVQEDLPDYVVEVFGSERTGLAFALSDIDLRLTPINLITDPALAKLPPTPEKRGELKDALIELHRKFRMERRDSYILPSLRWARYPLINVQHRGSSLDIQVVLANDSSANRECMQRYIAEYDYLPQLYSVIKATMDIRGLSDVFRGGVGSYPLFMMVVASLKHMPHPRNDAAGGLINFLRFWSKFKTEEHVLSIDPPALLNKSEEVVMRGKTVYRIMHGETSPLPLWVPTLRDPADETNDLGRKIIAWRHIQETIKQLSERLRKDLTGNTRVNFLAPLVGPIYTLHQAHRQKLTEYGHTLSGANNNSRPSLADIARSVREAESASSTPVVAETVGEAPAIPAEDGPAVDEVAAVARAVREGETSNEQSAREAEALDLAREANQNEKDGINPWLEEAAKESGPSETGQALSELLGGKQAEQREK